MRCEQIIKREEAECERTPCCRLLIVAPGSFAPSPQSLLVSYQLQLQIFSFTFIFEHIAIVRLRRSSLPQRLEQSGISIFGWRRKEHQDTKSSGHGRNHFPVNGRVGVGVGRAIGLKVRKLTRYLTSIRVTIHAFFGKVIKIQ